MVAPEAPIRALVFNLAGLLCLISAVAACDSGTSERPSQAAPPDRSFAVVARIELEETTKAPLGDIGVLTVASNGDLLVGDRLIPRVRRYDANGRLVAQFGTFGDGPYEFRRVGGVLEDRAGRVLIVDPRRGRVTALSADLVPDTSFRVRPPPAGSVVRFADGYLMQTVPGRRTRGFALMSEEWVSLWRMRAPVSLAAEGNPYWNGYATTKFTTSDHSLMVAYSFQYPIHVYNQEGNATVTLGEPPPSFREAPVLELGALTGPGAGERREKWLSSFTIIANLAVVADTLLVVTHGGLQEIGATGRVVEEHRAADVYLLRSGVKIAEDVPLPPGSRVMLGDRDGLYVVSAQPPEPWTISILQLVR